MTGLTEKPRHTTFDLLKGLAVLFMIQVHIVELFADPAFYASRAGRFLLFAGGPPCAPVFLFVFGYFIAASNKPALKLFVRGLILLATGLLLNIALNANLLVSVFRGEIDAHPLHFIFGVDILSHAGFSVLLIAALRSFFKKIPVGLVLLIILSAFLGKYLHETFPSSGADAYVLNIFYGASLWSYFPLFPWLAYTLTGFFIYHSGVLKKLKEYDSVVFRVVVFIVFAAFILFTGRFALHIASNLHLYYHHGLVFMVWVLVFGAFYGYIVYLSDRWSGSTLPLRYVRWLGAHVTQVYIIQWIIIGNTATVIFRSITSPWLLLLSFAGVVGVTSALTALIIYIRNRKSRMVL